MDADLVRGAGEFYFQFHILKNCNLRCRHCYQEGYTAPPLGGSASALRFIAQSIVTAMEKWHMRARVALTGGEPLLSPSFWPLLHYFDENDLVATLTVLSNGTLISDGIAKRLSNVTKLREVQVSLDGANSASHDSIRGSGAFSAALRGIQNLKRYNIPVAVMFTLMRQNIGEVGRLLDLAENEGVDFLTVERVVPCAGNSFSDKDVLTADEVCTTFAMVNEWSKRTERHIHIRRRRPLWALIGEDCGGFCPVGLSALSVLEDGTILPCRRLEIPIGNVVHDKGFFKAWYTSEVLWNVRNKNRLRGKCHGCGNLERCGGCRAVAYNLTGNYLEEDPQCWKKNQ